MDEEAILQRALMLSTQEAAQPKPQAAAAENEMKDLLQDNEFLQDIAKDLGIELPGEEKTDEQKKKEEEDKKK